MRSHRFAADALVCPLLLLFALILLPVTAFSQETTAGLEGTVKDTAGAAIPHASVELTGNKLIGSKVLETDGAGYYHFFNLPPGTYTVTVTASGFSKIIREGVVLETGHLPAVNVAMEVGATATTIQVNASETAIDPTQSLSQTNVTSEMIENLPRGTNFQSALAFTPGARNEPLQGGYAINGAATSENSYLVEGMDISSISNGLNSTNAWTGSGLSGKSIPFEFLEEVPIKTSGISAEDGGALGGVVNAVQRRGGNQWHGQVLTFFEAAPFDARGAGGVGATSASVSGNSLRFNPQIATPATRQDVPYQFYTPTRDNYHIVQPGFNIGGPLWNNKLWAFVATEPFFQRFSRTVNMTGYGPLTFSRNTELYYSLARVDAAITNRVRVYGAWYYNYLRVAGSSLPNADDVYGLYNTTSANSPAQYLHSIGYTTPGVLITAGADVTLTPSLILTSKYGYNYANYQDRGLPTGTRYTWNNSAQGVVGLDGTPIDPSSPAYFANGHSNISSNSQYLANQMARHQLNEDIAWFKSGWFGTHNFKAGYQFNHLYNNIANTYNTGLVELHWGIPYAPLATNLPRCDAINQTNIQRYGKSGSTGPNCMGDFGYADLREYGTIGAASSNNHGFYVQDSWQVAKGITANLGVRVEKESLPAYNQYPSGIDFSWGDKVSPRLGIAWDMLQNGKLKAFGSYGVFYDVMKTNLAIDSFGGAYWHNCFYALDSPDYSQIVPQRASNGHYCSGTGEANFAGGSTPSILRFIENQDYRIPANDPSQGAAVDPNLKPYRQHQVTAGMEFQAAPEWTLAATFVRNRVDNVIEDAGTITPAGETFLIINPGQGIDKQPVADCGGCKEQPKAARAYNGLEIAATKLTSHHWYAHLTYTYSRLTGNYSGLTGSDVADGGLNAPRNSPNDSRAFDEPFFQFDSHGRVFNGLLATDRPHSFNGTGYYVLPRIPGLSRNSISIGGQQYWYSGTPLSSYMNVGSGGGYPVYVEGRGKWVDATADSNGNITFGNPYVRRTPWFVQTDASFKDEFKVSNVHEGWKLSFEANVTNLFNRKAATEYSSNIDTGNKSGYIAPPGSTDADGNLNYAVLESGYDYKTLANTDGITLNGEYGQPGSWQAGRSIRLLARFTF